MTSQVHTGPHIANSHARLPTTKRGHTLPNSPMQERTGSCRTIQSHAVLYAMINDINEKEILTGSLDHKETERDKRARQFHNGPYKTILKHTRP